jgi:hypothetical protein
MVCFLRKAVAMRRIPLFAVLLAGAGCSEPDPMASYQYPTAPGYGRLAVGLSASQANGGGGGGSNGASRNNVLDLSELIVEVDRVTAHVAGGGWITLSEAPTTVDILRLQDSAVALGFADLPEGKITQIRLHVIEGSAPYVTLSENGEQVPLKVPSGMESGIKLKGPWDIRACTLTTVEIDLEWKKSIEKAIHVHPRGGGDLWILRPVIRVGGASADVGCDEETPPPGGNNPNDPSFDPDDDGDGVPDVDDPDADGDGVPDDPDGDGLPNSGDPDDDDDGFPDGMDTDDDGDGVPDMIDPSWPTPDTDDDGVPDILDGDDDGDGVPDAADPDRDGDGIPDDLDGDGIPNATDDDDDNDGLLDPVDGDDDNDGVPDEFDLDVPTADTDGDGIPDVIDPVNDGVTDPVGGDADGDGISDPADLDDDNDGIPDAQDPEPSLPGDGTIDPVGGGNTDPVGGGSTDPVGGGGTDPGTCSDSGQCGPTSYCGPAGVCEPLV